MRLNEIPMGSYCKGVVLLATLGERETIEVVLQEIAESCLSLQRFNWMLEVLIVDDSSDQSFACDVERLASTLGISIKVILGPRLGLGTAIATGFDAALEDRETSFLINLDADGQHDGRQIGDLLRAHKASGNAITIGSRWARGGRSYGLSKVRVVLSRLSSLGLRTVGVPWHVKDPTTSFRVYDRSAIHAIRDCLNTFNGFSIFGAIIAIADKSGLKIGEVPIHFRPRLAGHSNLQLPQIFNAARDLNKIRITVKQIKVRK